MPSPVRIFRRQLGGKSIFSSRSLASNPIPSVQASDADTLPELLNATFLDGLRPEIVESIRQSLNSNNSCVVDAEAGALPFED
jgi:hypothetical protein